MNENDKNLNVYYPIEAFALAMILFSKGMQAAMYVGIALVFGDVLLHVLNENLGKKAKYISGAIGILLVAGSLIFSYLYAGLTVDVKTVIGFAVLGLLLTKHHFALPEEAPDYNKILFADSIAYFFMVVLAVIREFLASGAIFGNKLADSFGLKSGTYGKIMMALVLTGIMLGILNAILKVSVKPEVAVWVCLPTIILEAPFVWSNVPEWLGTIIAIVITLIIYLTFRSRITMPRVSKNFRGLPVEIITLGMIYMIFSVL